MSLITYLQFSEYTHEGPTVLDNVLKVETNVGTFMVGVRPYYPFIPIVERYSPGAMELIEVLSSLMYGHRYEAQHVPCGRG